MGVSYETVSGRVPGVDGIVTGTVKVSTNASGEPYLRLLQNVRVDGAPIGTEDPRYRFIAIHARAE